MPKNLATLAAALFLLTGCSRFDETKELAVCRKVHPNPIDRLAVDTCLETAALKWAEANAWTPRVIERRSTMP
jgi:hypothetical protein